MDVWKASLKATSLGEHVLWCKKVAYGKWSRSHEQRALPTCWWMRAVPSSVVAMLNECGKMVGRCVRLPTGASRAKIISCPIFSCLPSCIK